ncbi:MAG: hypothetical protein ABR551_09355 [Gemmatimonadales bacterium]
MTVPQLLKAWAIASVVGGLWLGVAGRGVMVLIALAAGHALRWSWGGSIEIVIFGVILAAVAVAAWMLLRHLVPLLRYGRGLVFGLVLFGIFAVLPPPSAQSAAAGIGQHTLSMALFGALLVVFGILVESIVVRTLTRTGKHAE